MTADMPKQQPHKKIRLALASILAMLFDLQRREPDLTIEGLKALLVVALATSDDGQMRPPSVTKIARELDKTISSGSRLVSSLSEARMPPLMQGKLGVSGDRSEALLLTAEGRKL